MNFGIIGSGMIAAFHARAIELLDGSELIGVADSIPERATAFAEKTGTKAFGSVEEMLASDEIEIIAVGTPSGTHLECGMAAIEAGKHVLIEKPIEITTERIDQLVDAANKAGVTLAPIVNRRFYPAIEALKQALELGRFGRLTLCSAYVKWYRDQAYYDSGKWRGTWALDGGGALMNQSIHTIDQLIHFAGDVKSVSGNTACLTHTGIEVEDVAVAQLEFVNGARGVIEGTTTCWSSTGHPAEVAICGDTGSAFLNDESFRVWDFKDPHPMDDEVKAKLMAGSKQGLGANDPGAINPEGHRRNFADVVDAITGGREPTATALDARRAVALIRAIYESARNGGKVIELK